MDTTKKICTKMMVCDAKWCYRRWIIESDEIMCETNENIDRDSWAHERKDWRSVGDEKGGRKSSFSVHLTGRWYCTSPWPRYCLLDTTCKLYFYDHIHIVPSTNSWLCCVLQSTTYRSNVFFYSIAMHAKWTMSNSTDRFSYVTCKNSQWHRINWGLFFFLSH